MIGTDVEFQVLDRKRKRVASPYTDKSYMIGADNTPPVSELRPPPGETKAELLWHTMGLIPWLTDENPHVALPAVGTFSAGTHIHIEMEDSALNPERIGKETVLLEPSRLSTILNNALPIEELWRHWGLEELLFRRNLLKYGYPDDIRRASWFPQTSRNAIELRYWPTGLAHPALMAYTICAGSRVPENAPTTEEERSMLEAARKIDPRKDFRQQWRIRPLLNWRCPITTSANIQQLVTANEAIDHPVYIVDCATCQKAAKQLFKGQDIRNVRKAAKCTQGILNSYNPPEPIGFEELIACVAS